MSAGGITPLLPIIAPFVLAWEFVKNKCQELLDSLSSENSASDKRSFSNSHNLFYPSFSQIRLHNSDSNDLTSNDIPQKWTMSNS